MDFFLSPGLGRFVLRSAAVCTAGMLSFTALADIKLPAFFSDHMVLEKTTRVPIWGWAEGGEAITVTLGEQSATATASADGSWRVELDLSQSGPGPFEMTVAGRNTIRIADVVVGEVWLASGQSNMEWPLSSTTDAEAEIAQSANPMLRQFKVAHTASPEPLSTVQGTWVKASPQTAGSFSAVGYYFGKTLQKTLDRPVGLINSSWGGTPVEAWISSGALASDPDLNAGRKTIFESWASSTDYRKHFADRFNAWLKAAGREDRSRAAFVQNAAPTASVEGWEKVSLPGPVTFPGFDGHGAVWLRRDVVLSAKDILAPLPVQLGPIDGFDAIYWNGKPIAGTTPQQHPGAGAHRRVMIPVADLREGKNTLAVRIFAPTAPAAFTGKPEEFRAGSHSLKGNWLARAEFSLPALSAAELAAAPALPRPMPSPSHIGSFLFNGMIHPLVPYAISGVIWYQGESNASRAAQYRKAFPLLIQDWRHQWNNPDLPFYFCQLANYLEKTSTPGNHAWAELREAQTKALELPHTGQAVLIDLGEAQDIHPRNKKDVGERLARIALAKDYGKSEPFQGPTYQSMEIEGNRIRVRFTNTDGGLVARPLPETYPLRTLTGDTGILVRNSPKSEVEGFAICGKDEQWVWATAVIDGDSVVVSSEAVPEPVAVRYGWAANPTCNLYNGAGLPAGPFRTDSFPGVTDRAKYGSE